jgi:hypothetical protein
MRLRKMKKQNTSVKPVWIDEFETLYITTYQTLYRHGKLIFNQEEKVRELLILTYMEAYQRSSQLQKEKSPLEWLIKREDFWAETKLEATKEMLEASYAEEKMQSKEAKKKNRSNLDETSVLLEIEDRLGLVDAAETPAEKGNSRTVAKGVLSIVLVFLAAAVVVIGFYKVRQKLQHISEPFERRFSSYSDETVSLPAETEKKDIVIQVGDKAVFLSEIGQVLYTMPLSETELSGEEEMNPEIQKKDGWTYYLPCPERKDTRLSQVRPTLHHTLYRVSNDGTRAEIISQEVSNYRVWQDGIYAEKDERIQRFDIDKEFEEFEPGYYAVKEGEEIYIYDTLGRTLCTDADGSVHYGDRIFEMSCNRVVNVRPDSSVYGNHTYSLKETEKDGEMAVFEMVNGHESLFERQGKTIDSFCIAGNNLYYSACEKKGNSGVHYSQLYKKPLNGKEEATAIGERFKGRIYELYYSKEADQMYGDYAPKSWKSGYGVIAVISMNGQMSFLDDRELRSGTETTGDDYLEFVLIQDGDVYCYWNDCYWEKNEKPIVKWRKTLIIPDHNRIMTVK